MNAAEKQWAQEEFGQAALGDERRTRRLVKMAAQVASRPAGKVTEVFLRRDEREGSFRFLEDEDIAVNALQESAYQSTARRVSNEPYVYIPMDGSSLKLTDTEGSKGFGMVGNYAKKGAGVQVLTALCVTPSGRPLGLLGQAYWLRKRQQKTGKHAQKRTEEKETKYPVQMLGSVSQVLKEAGPCQPWFQMDRAGDAWPLWVERQRLGVMMAVRSSWNRRLSYSQENEGGPCTKRLKPNHRWAPIFFWFLRDPIGWSGPPRCRSARARYPCS